MSRYSFLGKYDNLYVKDIGIKSRMVGHAVTGIRGKKIKANKSSFIVVFNT